MKVPSVFLLVMSVLTAGAAQAGDVAATVTKINQVTVTWVDTLPVAWVKHYYLNGEEVAIVPTTRREAVLDNPARNGVTFSLILTDGRMLRLGCGADIKGLLVTECYNPQAAQGSTFAINLP